MIDGVKVKKLVKHVDDRGFFTEVLRDDEGLMTKFGQSSYTETHPGVIKAFHWHKKQDDLWFVATGQVLIVLYDLRKNSPTYQKTQTIKAGAGNYKLVLIPIGVAHGYKVLSQEPALLFYHVTQLYNPKDEQRIAYNDPKINFNWDKY